MIFNILLVILGMINGYFIKKMQIFRKIDQLMEDAVPTGYDPKEDSHTARLRALQAVGKFIDKI